MRYLPLTEADRRKMLAAIGVETVDDLFGDVPPDALLAEPVDLPMHADELEVERAFQAFAAENVSPASMPSFLGGGAYRHHIPGLGRSPDPARRVPHRVYALPAGNRPGHAAVPLRVPDAGGADHRHGGGERLALRRRDGLRRGDGDGLPVDPAQARAAVGRPASALACHVPKPTPVSWPSMRCRCRRRRPATSIRKSGWIADTACVVVQNPDVFGRVHDYRPLAAACHAKGALLVVAVAEVVSLGADHFAGRDGRRHRRRRGPVARQRPSFGGPTVGLFATRERFIPADARPPRRRDGRCGRHGAALC